MKKKLISILLAAALVAGLLCAPALAEEETGTRVYIAGVQLEEGREYTNADFWPLVPAPTPDPDPAPTDEPSPLPTPTPTGEPGSSQGSTEIPLPSPAAADPAANASAVYGGMTRSADSSDWNAKLEGGTLYIKDLSVMGVANDETYGAAIFSGPSLTIVLEGVNSAIGADIDGGRAEGISAAGGLVVEGDGTLTVTGGNADYASWGIGSDIVKITDGATVIATGGTATLSSYGIFSETTVTIENGATVVATGGSTDGNSYGIRSSGVTIKNGATVIATGGNVSDEDGSSASYGISSDLSITINSSTVVARGGTVGGAFSGDRKAVNGSVNLTDAKLAGGVVNEAEQGTPNATTATSLAIVPTAWTENELPEAEAGDTYNIDNDTYIVRPDACALEIKSDATIDAEGKTLLAVSLFEGDGNTAGIYSTASVTLKGNIIAVGGLASAVVGVSPSSGFEAPAEAQGETVTIEGALLAVGAGTPKGFGCGYSSEAYTRVTGTLTGVGVSGRYTYGLDIGNGLTVERGGAVLGYAGPASDRTPIAVGIEVSGDIFAEGNITGVGAGHGLSGAYSVDGGTYLGKQGAVSAANPAEGYAFYNADGNVPADVAAEQYLTVGLKKYNIFFHMGGDLVMEIGDIPHNRTAQETFEETYPGEKIEEAFVPERDGYTFGGWYASDDGGTTLSAARYDFNTPVTADVHLYPKWTRPSSGGSGTPAKAPCPQDHTCPIAPFEDADPKGWYHDGVHYCIEQELMIGTGEAEFQPHGATSRAMIVTILHRLAGEPEATTTGTFTDVADGLWYSEAIEWAAAKGIVEGNGAGAFAPEADLTREQMATILYRYAQYLGEGFTGAWAFRLDFADLGEMSEWAYEGVSWCAMNGLLEGDDKGLLRPGDGLERCEMATLLYRLCENILK